MQEADSTVEWDEPIVRLFLKYAPPASTSLATIAGATAGLEIQIETLVASLAPAEVAVLKTQFNTNTQIPQDHDRALLRIGRTHYGQETLSDLERKTLRSTFVRMVQARP